MLRQASWQKMYPVEGESAVAELRFGEEVIGDVRMVGGEVRVALYPATSGVREFDFSQFVGVLGEARDWLVANERGREEV